MARCQAWKSSNKGNDLSSRSEAAKEYRKKRGGERRGEKEEETSTRALQLQGSMVAGRWPHVWVRAEVF